MPINPYAAGAAAMDACGQEERLRPDVFGLDASDLDAKEHRQQTANSGLPSSPCSPPDAEH